MNGRVRRIIDEYEDRWPHVAIGLLVLAVIALGIAGVAYVNAPTETVVTDTDSAQSQLTIETRAEVTENTRLYDKGDVVRNSPLYVLDTMPRATLELTTLLPADARNTTVTTSAYVVLTASDQGVTFWSERYTVLDDRMLAATNGTAQVNATIPVAHLRSRGLAIRQVYHHRGTVEMRLVVRSAYETDAYSGTLTANIPIQVDKKTYSIGRGKATMTKSHTDVTTTERPVRFKYAGPFLIVAGVLAVLGGLAAGLRRVADGSRTEWDYELVRFDEWISRGSVTLGEVTQIVEEESVEDLVDVAIDSGNRVVYDVEKEACLVIDDTTIHYTTRPRSSWVPSLDTQE